LSIKGLAHYYSQAELWQGEDDILPPLDLCELSREEVEEGEAKVDLYILAGF